MHTCNANTWEDHEFKSSLSTWVSFSKQTLPVLKSPRNSKRGVERSIQSRVAQQRVSKACSGVNIQVKKKGPCPLMLEPKGDEDVYTKKLNLGAGEK